MMSSRCCIQIKILSIIMWIQGEFINYIIQTFLKFYRMQQPQVHSLSLQHQILISSFKEEVSSKLFQLQKLSYNLSLKSNANVKNISNEILNGMNSGTKKKNNTNEIVQLCRYNIQEIQQIFVDVHCYFVDLKIQFVYDLLVQIFKTMVVSFKVLSEKFVAFLKNQAKNEKQLQKHNKQNIFNDFKSKNFTDLQYFDILIKSIEVDELRLAEQKRQAEKKMIIDKDQLQNFNASDAFNQLQGLRKQLDKVIITSIRINDEWTSLRGLETNIQMKSIKSPQQIQAEYCESISANTRSIFLKKMEQIAQRYYNSNRQKQKQNILKQIEKNKPPCFDKETQLNENELKQKIEKGRDRAALLTENQYLKKINMNLRKEIYDLQEEKQTMLIQVKEFEDKNKAMNETLNKKIFQLYKAKLDFQHALVKKDQVIQAGNKQIQQLQTKLEEYRRLFQVNSTDKYINSGYSIEEESEQNNGTAKCANQTARTQRTSFFYERQFKITKQQNSQLRRGLEMLIEVLYEQKMILEYPVDELNNDLRLGKLISKMEQISIELLTKINQIKAQQLKQQPKSLNKSNKKPIIRSQKLISDKQNIQFMKEKEKTFELKSRTQLRSCFSSRKILARQKQLSNSDSKSSKSLSKNKIVIRIQQSTQTPWPFPNVHSTVHSHSPSPLINHSRGGSTHPQIHANEVVVDVKGKAGHNKLEMLKKELINKIHKGVEKQRQMSSTLKLNKPQQSSFLHHERNMSLQNCNSKAVRPAAETQRRTSRRRPVFNSKDISFEQLKFTMKQKKPNGIQKKTAINRNKAAPAPKQLLVPRKSAQVSHHIRQQRRSTNRSLQIGCLFEQIQYPKMKEDLNVLGIQGYECSVEVKKFMQMIQSKKDKKDQYFRFFLGKLIADLKRTQGYKLIEQVLQSNNKKRNPNNENKSLLIPCK